MSWRSAPRRAADPGTAPTCRPLPCRHSPLGGRRPGGLPFARPWCCPASSVLWRRSVPSLPRHCRAALPPPCSRGSPRQPLQARRHRQLRCPRPQFLGPPGRRASAVQGQRPALVHQQVAWTMSAMCSHRDGPQPVQHRLFGRALTWLARPVGGPHWHLPGSPPMPGRSGFRARRETRAEPR